ncbi:Cytochrome P450, conserved site,Cytochrome P450,Cytochrome P450, E-class, group I [Cinara cedri]|uniref:Cytochrome P450, conserved site,Cytochrome P450,Cytochrome P450, E-class, group I n=1 Tax=Cinara cedri TaxID=506608 RepID=A0A5E4M363_9HEMI|nr:Cytochrome P450, conserved site,Cytochrome P450,Cytochrome P450, E-class, group I [Cinara cedri]
MDTANGVVADAGAVALPLLLLLLLMTVVAAYHRRRRPLPITSSDTGDAPSPTVPNGPAAYPIIGALHAMDGHRDQPFRRFTELARLYGPVYAMAMGSVPCVIVNDYPSIKEVLITNGSKFGGRPNFIRYNVLFAGDRNNSLALCDWSWLQETRRKIARMYCSPKVCSSNYGLLDSIASDEVDVFFKSLATTTACDGSDSVVQLKPLLLMACANMFVRFMCSKQFSYKDPEFQTMVRTFDEIFWDINQGYAVDFLPWLRPFYAGHMKQLSEWSAYIRRFIMDNVVSTRSSYIKAVMEASDADGNRYYHDDADDKQEPNDFTDALLMSLRKEPGLKMDHVLFELEDFIGGHSAVGNLVMLALSMVATRPHVAQAVRDEAERVTGGQRLVRLYDKSEMPYTEATLFETLRMISSPIVPHVATENTTIKGFKIVKDTCIIINNYELNTSPEYWENPELFEPERFVQRKPDAKPCIKKPEYFLPFSTGKRTCIGQQLVTGFGFVLLACVLQRYEVKATDQLAIPEARMALPPDTYPLILKPYSNGSPSKNEKF